MSSDDAKQPGASGRNGLVPPPEHRWKPGQSGNPAGRKTAGATMREYLNAMVETELTEAQIRAVAKDSSQPLARRAAAERLLTLVEAGDIADFEGWLQGTKTLEQLKAEGKDTSILKTASVSAEGGRRIELHNRAGDDFDRIMDRTEGKPNQSIDVQTNSPVAVRIVTPLTSDAK